ncbi:Gamma-glutamyl-hercynylcysteine sulfoxide hydrolase [Austwickia sp. TVS 96-490-7B]|uniref:class II glutamine amidotransferase n=1 Tax=Austwickia sp. TVS 96-490-7B TaxID=2830843 RepID=UPI001C599A39|nr:class II glutamine amidotransferase [Austwickia sp. TVS 96-490-7B]MBW3085203.1 Gamma-glutamyl-hercynylcysteine sulfoxide hydrolase [Austwickia sp. TVS 96-490-7B]
MCRLLAYAAPHAVAVEELIGTEQCQTYRLMARLHDDGWGTAWIEDGSRGPVVRRRRTVRPGYDDDRLTQMMDRPRSRSRIFHLRMATDQMAVMKDNSHPFRADGMAFAHNGSIAPTAVLRAMVGPAALAKVTGTTDSELYFALIREGVAAGLPLTEAAALAVRRIRTAYPQVSLNSVTLSATEMVVVNSSREAQIPHWQVDDLPLHHDERYFTMRWRRLVDGSLVVASAGLDTAGWKELPHDSVTRVDLRTMAVSCEPLAMVSMGVGA